MNGRYCALIPAFEAGETIGEIVRRIAAQGIGVIVVDDGSRDQTASVAATNGALVISHLHNQGKGSALRTGFEYVLRSRYDGVVTLDGDGQHDPMEIHRLIRAGEIQHAGIVLGNRMTNGAVMPPLRQWTNRLMSSVISSLIRQSIPDTQCGFRFIRREVLETVPLRTTHFEIETELLLSASAKRWKIISVPVRSIYQNRHRSHIRPAREAVRFCRIMLGHLLYRLLKHPSK